MDPVSHTLVGAALAEAGLKKRTAGGGAALLIGANLPDIDIISTLWSAETMLWFRRGLTHGVLGVIVLPIVLTAVMVSWDRLWRLRRKSGPPMRTGPLLILSYIATASHPALDFLNVYGMRWLHPFSTSWSYGDTLFIIDPWIWAMLLAGVLVSRRAAATRPARIGLAAFAVYAGLMGVSGLAARERVRSSAEAKGIAVERMMVAPVPVNPLRRWVVIESSNRFHVGEFRWLSRPQLALDDITYRRFPSRPPAAQAASARQVRRYLSWARFPHDRIEDRGDHYLVSIGDARYTLDPEHGWASTSVRVGKTGKAEGR